jgi:hypothetical protein
MNQINFLELQEGDNMNNKLISILMVSVLAIGGSLGTILVAPVSVNVPGDTYVSFVISTDTTWTLAGSPYIVVGNLLVDNGVTLTIEPGVEVRFDGYYFLQVEGVLIADGTATDMITFTSNMSSPAPDDWESIIFMDNADLGSSITYCTIEYAYDAIAVEHSNPFAILNITHNIIRHNEYSGIKFFPYAPTPSTIDPVNRIMHNTFSYNHGRAIWIHYYVGSEQANLKIGDNHIQNSYSDGIDCSSYNGKVEIFNNTILECEGWGIRIVAVENSETYDNYISNNIYGGIYVRGDGFCNIIMENNTITENPAGISFYLFEAPNYLYFRNNNIMDNSPYNAINNFEPDIIATNNWWGTTDTDLINQSIYDYWDDFNRGEIIYMPFLKESTNGRMIRMSQGYNMISIPYVQQNNELEEVMASISEKYSSVQWYDSSDPDDPWKAYNEEKPEDLNDLETVDHTMALIVYVDSNDDTNFICNGDEITSNQNIQLYAGWNMVGYPSLTTRDRTSGLNNLVFGTDVDCIQWLDAASQTWHFMDSGDSFTPGIGYMVHSKVDAVWDVPL